MNKAKWNLEIFDNQCIKIYQIYADIDNSEASAEDVALRMNILSHQISYQKVPAFFLENQLKYFETMEKKNFCIAFDVFNQFDEISIPYWCKFQSIEWHPSEMYEKDIVELFQKALTLYYLYALHEYSPFYFTSFLFIEEDPVSYEPFFFKPMPVLHQGKLGVRHINHFDETTIPNTPELLKPGSSVLICPNELPYTILSVNSDSFTIQIPDGNITLYEFENTDFLVLTKYSRNFLKSKSTPKRISSNEKISSEFAPIQTFSFTPTNFKDFYEANFVINDDENTANWNSQNQTILEDAPYTVEDLIKDQCSSEAMKESIKRYAGKIPIPIKRNPLMRHTIMITPIDLNLGFPTAKLQIISPKFQIINEFNYDQFYPPNLKVIEKESVQIIQADRIFDQWVENCRCPLSGSKDLHYLIFCETDQSKQQVLDYIHLVSSSYTKFRLGKMTPANQPEEILSPSGNEALEDTIVKYLDGNTTLDFANNKYIIFVISDNNFDSIMKGYFVFVRPEWVKSPNLTDIDSIGFQIYARIRELRSEPFGSFEITSCFDKIVPPADNLFFNMRYQPPFILSTDNPFVLHVALDLKSQVAVYSDHECLMLKIDKIQNFDSIKNYAKGIPSILGVNSIETVITIFTESMPQNILNRIQNEMSELDCTILSLFPMTGIQVSDEMGTDGIVEISESRFNFTGVRPDSTVLVVSPTLESYKISIYGGTSDKLRSIARNFVDLSWVSVKPGMPRRTTSLPPHIVGLVKGCFPDLKDLTPLDFLPPKNLDF
ncbi:hypothetical protein TVAG_392920 [Trichomonas vaginalis G3]|uniref:Uncharacterized protein n=1 Tax=Trichomonas vaginalis (strain ATCC PRA-98 / G3) TaxID=412133 RepID=A2DY88_TRIV3|nr:hypothetical protein TVAGG3_0281420 [Trichomonas vaginalis G3]EAY14565.1 hypothetical protein TVAG_392920 [Trichomonas vaginalis G3]KAI5526575.1 hypothetical protein TVAGG3_0281420 [Trichomonas vaginalis G3]|eukprot:XP_001326788.1 hypothetical protein [Trichomonas vaginalis G3]